MIEFRNGNLVTALLNKEVDFMLHVCNCQNNFGSGIAKEVRERIPDAYKVDTFFSERGGNNLGDYSASTSGVINLYAQEFYGKVGSHFKKYGHQLDYNALIKSIRSVSECVCRNDVIGIPYKMGCDRAGGNWDVVLHIIEVILKDFKVIIYQLED